MKILHIVSGGLSGGAARGTLWLHEALLSLGVDSYILNNTPIKGDRYIVELSEQPVNMLLEREMFSIFPKESDFIFSTGLVGIDLSVLPYIDDFDVIHLHWINNSFIDISCLSKLDKPVVWTVRDMWPMTGGCHYNFDCTKFIHGCYQCQQLQKSKQDLAKLIFETKFECYPENLELVGISQWVSEQLKLSKLFSKSNITTISNNVDIDKFISLDKKQSKKELNLPLDKKVLLFGANDISDPYKGFEKLVELSFLLSDNYHLVIFGSSKVNVLSKLGCSYTYLGKIANDIHLNKVYSSADIFLALSTQEAFGKTLVESMLSGTPVVCFDYSGPKDIVEHRVDGYRAKPFYVKDVLYGIKWIEENYSLVKYAAIENAKRKFNGTQSAKKYISLYNKVLESPVKKNKEKVITSIFKEKELILNNAKHSIMNDTQNYVSFFYEYLRKLTKCHEKIVIYGNGTISKTIQALIPTKIISYVDIADTENHPSKLPSMQFDKILISVLGREAEITAYLVNELGISADKIITFEL